MFSCVLGFVAETQDLALHDTHFDEFTIVSLTEFKYRDREELLLCPIGAFKPYPSWTELCRPAFRTFSSQ